MLQTPELRVISSKELSSLTSRLFRSRSAVGLSINDVLLVPPPDDFGGHVLCYNSKNLFSDSQELAKLISSFLPEMSFIEFADFNKLLEATPLKILLSPLAEIYGWNPNEHFWNSVHGTASFPAHFKQWLADKKVHPTELAPIFLLREEPLEFQNVFWKLASHISENGLNKNFGIKILELLCELLLLGKMEPQLQPHLQPQLQPVSAEKWYEQLKSLRYPQTLLREHSQREEWMRLPWPKSFNAKFVRQNDRTGIEFKVFISQQEDLKKYLAGLQLIQRELEK